MFLRAILRFTRYSTLPLSNQQRHASILSSLNSSPVLVSSNKDIYTNLALEHWLYNNLRFDSSASPNDKNISQTPIVLIWTDEPCVVIGRHQNPWIESTLGFVNKAGIKLARRHSGGGCVYHDENNINISIIGDRKLFDRRQDNLKFLASVLLDKYGIKCEPTKRHDLVHLPTGLKMSGSAAKLGRTNSYHHFTLLVDTDKEVMETAIRQKPQDSIQTNSSSSIRSKVINLKDINGDLTVEQVMTDLVQAYNDHYKSNRKSEARQSTIQGDQDDLSSLDSFRQELASWKWIYGMTPKFKIEKSITFLEKDQEKLIKLVVDVNRGLFEKVSIDGELSEKFRHGKFDHLVGTRFTYKDSMLNIVQTLKEDEAELQQSGFMAGEEQIFTTLLLQIVQEANL